MSTRVRVIDLEKTGSRSPAYAVCEIGWQNEVLSESGRWVVSDNGRGQLVNRGRPTPPVTTAVRHIIDAVVSRGVV